MRRHVAARADRFGECITRRSSLLAKESGAINLAQGFPEEEPPPSVKEAALRALRDGPNQYADMRGDADLRLAVADVSSASLGLPGLDPDRNVTITCGATEALAAALLASVEPGEEVLISSPSYENYPPQVLLAGGEPRFFELTPPAWGLDLERLRTLFSPRTKAIILNNPNNPTGRVFTRQELEGIARLCCEFDVLAITDEIYDRLIWDGRRHLSLAALDGMAERTIIAGGISKTYAATGWRVGWAIAPEGLTGAIRRVHDFLTAVVPTPLQKAAIQALHLPREYYVALRARYEERRGTLARYLEQAGFDLAMPEGTYYFFPSSTDLGWPDSTVFAARLRDEGGVAVVPWPAFFRRGGEGQGRFRINFAKSVETLEVAGERILRFCRETAPTTAGVRASSIGRA